MVLTQEQLVQQQILAAQQANAAYMAAKESGTPIPISQNPTIAPGSYVAPTMSQDVANTSKSQLYAEAEAYAAYYGGNAYDIYNQRVESIGPSQRYLDLTAQYSQQHYNIVTYGSGTGTVLQYNPQTGGYVYGAGYSRDIQGTSFQSNVLTQYQQQSLDSALTSQNPTVLDLLNIRGLQAMDPTILSGSINSQIGNQQVSRNLAGFLTSPSERLPYEQWYWGEGGATARTPMEATYLGRGDSARFAPPPGSVTERFGFDEYGKVLGIGGFEPAFSNEGIPYNSKMGSGDYRYVGEYRYSSGEVVSRFAEKNVGSFVDFTKFGVMSEPMVGIRGGGSPGAFYRTGGYDAAMRNMPGSSPASAPTPFVSTSSGTPSAPQQRDWLSQLNYDVGGFLGIRASGLEQSTTVYQGTQMSSMGPTTVTTAPAPFKSTLPGAEQKSWIPFMEEYKSLERGASEFLGGFLPKGTKEALGAETIAYGEMAKSAPASPLFGMSVGVSEAYGFVEAPIRAGASYALGLAGGAVFRGFGEAYAGARGIAASKIISEGGNWRRAEQATNLVMTQGPKVLGAVYGFDVASRSTSGFSDFNPVSITQRAVPIATYETVPMGIGFATGWKAPELIRSVSGKIQTGVESFRPAAEKFGTIIESAKVEAKYQANQLGGRFGLTEYESGIITYGQYGARPTGKFTSDTSLVGIRGGMGRRMSWQETIGHDKPFWGGGSSSSRPTPTQESLHYQPSRLIKGATTAIGMPKMDVGSTTRTIGGVKTSAPLKDMTPKARFGERYKQAPINPIESAKSVFKKIPGTNIFKAFYPKEVSSGGSIGGGSSVPPGFEGRKAFGNKAVVEFRTPSSGMASVEESLPKMDSGVPQLFQRSRNKFVESEYVYEPRRLPPGMERPSSMDYIQERVPLGETRLGVVPIHSLNLRLNIDSSRIQVPMVSPAMESAQAINPMGRSEVITEARSRQDQITRQIQNPMQVPVMSPLSATSQLPSEMTRQRNIQIQDPVSFQTPVQTPGLKTITSPFTETRQRADTTFVNPPTPTKTVTFRNPEPTTTPTPDRTVIRDFEIIEPPPVRIPGFGGGPFGGGGSNQYGSGRWTRWARDNPVADIPYLSRGLGGPWAGKKGKKKKGVFTGFGNFEKSPF